MTLLEPAPIEAFQTFTNTYSFTFQAPVSPSPSRGSPPSVPLRPGADPFATAGEPTHGGRNLKGLRARAQLAAYAGVGAWRKACRGCLVKVLGSSRLFLFGFAIIPPRLCSQARGHTQIVNRKGPRKKGIKHHLYQARVKQMLNGLHRSLGCEVITKHHFF